MTIAELKAADAIQRIPQSMGELNQTLIRIADALERQNSIVEQVLKRVPTLPADPLSPKVPTAPSFADDRPNAKDQRGTPFDAIL